MTIVSSGRRFLVTTAALVMTVGVFGDRPDAQQAATTGTGGNFDIRNGAASAGGTYRAVDASVSAGVAGAREAGVARLRADHAGIVLENSPLTGALEIVGARPGDVLARAGADRARTMRGFLAQYADAYGMSAGQVQDLKLVVDYVNPAGNMAWVEFEQVINGIPVFQGLIRGGFTRSGELARLTGPLASGLDAGALLVSAALDAATAVSRAAAHVGWSVPARSLVLRSRDADGQRVTFDKSTMADDATAWPVYFPLAPGVARLAWATQIWGDPDAFLIVVDAQDGTVLFRKNLTSYQTQLATYNVYNDDSPAPMSPSTTLPGQGTQAPFIGRSTITLVGNEAPNTFNSLGWMTDGLNETDGNNVRAGLDLVPPDGIESTVTGSAFRIFNFNYDPQTNSPTLAAYRNGEVTDMFYWTNWYHDRLYLLGFNEAARNFQNDNFGRGGLGNDKIKAEGQDYSGTSNANFSTPPDGSQGRMQMYIFPGPTPGRTSGIDHDVVLHELTHGTSNRLHNNASGLATQVSAGMGEGWSDFYARALLSTAAENVNGIYSTGGWVTYQLSPGFVDNYYYGIRRFPYAVKTTVGANGKPHNPLTFADIDPARINLSDGAFPPAFVGTASEVHNIGEVWCMALLEVRARFITRLGFAVGNQRFLQMVTDGMKLDPTNPTPLQARDAILSAALAGGGTAADTADIWAGFAARGMGVQAIFDGNIFGVGESFNVPGDPLPPAVITGGASNIGALSASFNGSVIAAGSATTANFEYGPTTAYGSVTAPQAVGSGGAVVVFTAVVGGLTCNSTYHYRATATNANGTARGSDTTFTTTACGPLVTTTIPTGFTASGAILNGTANPNGFATNAWFEYGLTTVYGSATPVQALAAGTIAVPISGGTVSGLACDTVYHFRARGTNALGTLFGADRTFSAPCSSTVSPSLLVVANDTNALRVFSASTLATVATIAVSAATPFDVVVMPNQSLAFAARSDGIWVVDLSLSPPALAAGLNPIPTPASMPFVEDMAVTRDNRFLVASDGSGASPIAVIDTATRGVVGTINVLADHNSVEVCDNGSVLVTSTTTNLVRRLTIGATGTITDTGQTLSLPSSARPNNTACAPGGTVAVAVNFSTGNLQSFIVNGMTPVSTQVLPGGLGICVAISRDGTKVFGRGSGGNLTAYAFNSTTGVIGAQVWSTDNLGPANSFFGVDQIALDPGGTRIYVGAGPGFVVAMNTTTGAIVGSAVATSPTGIALRRAPTSVRGDYDGDGNDDLSVYRPSTGDWYALKSSSNNTTYLARTWGLASDVPLLGDYDGDGKADLAVYRPSTGVWYVLQSSTNFTTYMAQSWGVSSDIPVPGDYDGDGKTDLAVYRPSTGVWYVLLSSTNFTTYMSQVWGVSTDIPVPGDYDGDGKIDPAVYRPSTGVWYVLQSSTNYTKYVAQGWGVNTDIPVPGDYDGDGKNDLAVYRPSTGGWYVLQSSTNFTTYMAQVWGVSTDIPVPGDYDGDGKIDPAVYRPSTGVWYVLQSSTNYTKYVAQQWGVSTDVPVPRRP